MEKLQTVIFLVRHGVTTLAQSDNPSIDDRRILSEEGRKQIKKIGEYLADFDIAKIYTSPTKRTQETADILSYITGVSGKPVVEKKLYEIYDDVRFQEVEKVEVPFVKDIVRQNTGKQVVLVSHLLVIQEILKLLGATKDEVSGFCREGEMYRLVFAGNTFVECRKISL